MFLSVNVLQCRLSDLCFSFAAFTAFPASAVAASALSFFVMGFKPPLYKGCAPFSLPKDFWKFFAFGLTLRQGAERGGVGEGEEGGGGRRGGTGFELSAGAPRKPRRGGAGGVRAGGDPARAVRSCNIRVRPATTPTAPPLWTWRRFGARRQSPPSSPRHHLASSPHTSTSSPKRKNAPQESITPALRCRGDGSSTTVPSGARRGRVYQHLRHPPSTHRSANPRTLHFLSSS